LELLTVSSNNKEMKKGGTRLGTISYHSVKFMDFKATNNMITVFGDVTPCSTVDGY
jgi:hypothetical protein